MISQIRQESTPQARRALMAGIVGNVLEWYDFGVYGYFAGVIAVLFFPPGDITAATISTFGIFAAGFIMRPVGAFVFGYIGDKKGRKTALIASILLMAFPTMAMGLLPTYATIGISAALLLTLMRLLQGLSLGGEFTSSASFLAEHAPPHRRGFYVSFTAAAAIAGILIGSLVGALLTTFLTHEQLHEWGWRVAFIGGVIIGVVGLIMRRGLKESETFEQVQEQAERKNPIAAIAGGTMRPFVLLVAGLVASITSQFYVCFVFMPNHIGSSGLLPLSTALQINTIAMAAIIVALPLFGLLSDKIGRKPVLFGGVLSGLLLAPLLVYAALSGNALLLFVVLVCCGASQGAQLASVTIAMIEMFPTEVRLTAVSVGYNISIALFGGSAPMIATKAVAVTGNLYSAAAYLAFCSAISLFALSKTKETAFLSLDTLQPRDAH